MKIMVKNNPGKNTTKSAFSLKIWIPYYGSPQNYKKLTNRCLLNAYKDLREASVDSLITQTKNKSFFGYGEKWLPIIKKEIEYRNLSIFL